MPSEVDGGAPPLNRFDLSEVRKPSDGILYLYRSFNDGFWHITDDADMAIQEATGYPVGELQNFERLDDDAICQEAECGDVIAIYVADEDEATERIDGDLLDREAEALVELFNDAAPEYAPQLEWFAMSHDRETGDQQFVLEAGMYIDGDGLAALQERGWTVEYIEAYEYDGEIGVQINVPVRGEIPDPSGTETSQDGGSA